MAKKVAVPDEPVVAPTETEGDVKVTVRSTPVVVKTADPEPEAPKPELSVHHELTITPPSEAKPVAETEVPEAPEAQPEVTQTLESPKPPSDDTPKTDPKSTNAQTSPKTDDMQSPKVFDTKQYHLPIDEGAAGGKGKFAMIFIIVLLLVVVAGVVAIDAEWVDVGFDLPFDLIK